MHICSCCRIFSSSHHEFQGIAAIQSLSRLSTPDICFSKMKKEWMKNPQDYGIKNFNSQCFTSLSALGHLEHSEQLKFVTGMHWFSEFSLLACDLARKGEEFAEVVERILSSLVLWFEISPFRKPGQIRSVSGTLHSLLLLSLILLSRLSYNYTFHCCQG